MRALTVRQPWASLIVAGLKDVENRTWPVPSTVAQFIDGITYVPDGEGWLVAVPEVRIAIHAGRALERDALAGGYVIRETLRGLGWGSPDEFKRDCPLGALLCTVRLTGCHHADDCRWYERAVHDDGRRSARLHGVHHCSPWAEPNTYHWTLADPVELDDEPIPMRGRQGLWTVPDDALAEVAA